VVASTMTMFFVKHWDMNFVLAAAPQSTRAPDVILLVMRCDDYIYRTIDKRFVTCLILASFFFDSVCNLRKYRSKADLCRQCEANAESHFCVNSP